MQIIGKQPVNANRGIMTARGMVLIICLICLANLIPAGGRGEERETPDSLAKLTFPLDHLNQEGLVGPPGGLRAMNYEFCIPGDAAHAAEIRAIDPTVRVFPHSRGRIACGPGEYLCVGSTHQPGFRKILRRLADLPYVRRIDQAFFE
jgi:hypothetical protein